MRRYVNIYSLVRQYGGPEEGGWWYDEGTPIGSIPIDISEEEERAILVQARREQGMIVAPELFEKYLDAYLQGRAEAIQARYQRLYPATGKRHRYTVGGGDYRVAIEDHFARHYPTERPRYE